MSRMPTSVTFILEKCHFDGEINDKCFVELCLSLFSVVVIEYARSGNL